MNGDDAADLDDEQLLADGRAWLAEHAPAYVSDRVELSTFANTTDVAHREAVERARRWERRRWEAGWAGLNVPCELGGRGRSVAVALRFDELEHEHRLPLDVCLVGRAMVLPTLLVWGTERQRRLLVPRLLNGSDMWCQLFSEPDAGSDLAAVTTWARRDGEGWIVTGHKIWTSYGAESDRGYLLARTGPDKHTGLTTFVVDMASPGVTATTIRQATGSQTFSEVFFDDVRLGDDAVLGEPGRGWKVVHTTLMNERLALNSAAIPLDALVALAGRRGALDDGRVRHELVRLYAQKRVAELARQELVTAVEQDREPGSEGSLAKIIVARATHESGRLAARLQGPDALADDEWSRVTMGAFGLSTGGGTEEVLKTMLGERVLDLPREPRPSRY